MAGPVTGTELIGELRAGRGCQAWKRVEAVPPPPVGPPPQGDGVSAAAGRLFLRLGVVYHFRKVYKNNPD